jgi:hypothetical protein
MRLHAKWCSRVRRGIGIAVTVLEPRARILCIVTVVPSVLSWSFSGKSPDRAAVGTMERQGS